MADAWRGRPNPCGAYYPGSFIDLPVANTDCAENGTDDHNGLGYGGESRGFCCDMMSRIDATSQWQYSYNYKPFVTAFAVKGTCKGCPNQVFRPHVSAEGACPIGNPEDGQPCRYNIFSCWVGGWDETWHQCYFGLSDAFGCTNPNSFGLITSSTPPGAIGKPGSPNGTCQANCMTLEDNYFSNYAVSGADRSLADYPPITYDRKYYFDCEPPVYDSNGSAGASGSKLIWTGYSPRVVNYPYQNAVTTIDDVDYRIKEGSWEGYLNENHNINNGWGQVGGPKNDTPHLWNRKSGFDVTDASPVTSFYDFDSCCTFVSFGCKDPAFGNYDSQALLNCDGISQLNVTDVNGGCPGGAEICYSSEFNCSACINPNTNNYDPALIDLGPYNPLSADTCYQETWDACGGGGTLSQTAWNQMNANRPTSDLYGQGQFWDKDGQNVTNGGDRPLCQCNNQGCVLPGMSNYSPINNRDCDGNSIGANPAVDNANYCCITQQFGCTDATFNTAPTNNYFCTTGIGPVPDNADLCMDPDTGNPCADSLLTTWNCGPGSGVTPLGGVPMNPSLPDGTFINSNITVNLTEDGSCANVVISGCKDDGGISNGGTWPSPLYPGFSSLNFNPNATLHVQSQCEYAFGCVDILAENVLPNTSGIDTSVCGGISLQDKANQINAIPPPDPSNPPPVINAAFVADNLIPDITCCDYNLPGEGPGCTDPNALNYNPNANTDDGSCIYNTEGCTDPTAINFNPNATLDDGSCIYSLDFPEEGTNFLDGSLVELCREPLVKEEVLMNVCQPTEIQSEVFIERGKQSVFETNQRLGEVRTIGGLLIYGYGFYNIKEQI
mgnify:CR=1 FL=1|tara:strand:+ start:984 stop:3491 length:2508 start_codon:yes stop_codon:yes gene_type:complete